jgi:hypothetical protein
MNREVNLTKRVQTPDGWRYCTVVLSANGRVKPDLVCRKRQAGNPQGRRVPPRVARRLWYWPIEETSSAPLEWLWD